ncbi:MAG: VOC family protein [Deltaproteobacteria bacterium]|nr:VOC family protein [Deltaproteobacteria bacterium]
MFDHMGIHVRDWEKSRKFYELALAPLGIKLLRNYDEYKVSGYGTERPQFWVGTGEKKPINGEKEVHICFTAKTHAEVKAFYDAAMKAGARDNGAPGLRPEYHENYYGAFVLDPDGHNIEACCQIPQ